MIEQNQKISYKHLNDFRINVAELSCTLFSSFTGIPYDTVKTIEKEWKRNPDAFIELNHEHKRQLDKLQQQKQHRRCEVSYKGGSFRSDISKYFCFLFPLFTILFLLLFIVNIFG